MSHDAARVPPNGIPVGLFGESSRAGNQSEKEPSALSHFLSCISESTAWKAITPLKEACISRLNPNSNLSTSDVNVSFADLRVRYPDLAIITPCLSRGRVVVSAVKSGHYDIVATLLQNGQISDEHRGEAVMNAAEYGYHDIVKTLLQNGQISDEDRGTAVMNAAVHGHVDVIEMLLQNGSISEDNRGQAVINAARNGHVDIVETLLQNGPISDWYRGWAVINAARNGHVQVIDTLLRNGAISIQDRGWAVMKAAGNGNVQVIDTLLQNGSISEDHRGRAVMKAAGNGNVQVIDTLLRNGPISIQDRGWAVVYVATRGHVQVIDTLLQNGQISDEHRGMAVEKAAGNGNVQVIDTLLRNGAQISVEHLGQAVVNAAEYAHVQVIDTLLQNGQISDEHRGIAVAHAAGNGNVQVIDTLLRNGQISDVHRGIAVVYAAGCRNPNLIQGIIGRLLQDGAGIPLQFLHQAIWFLNERQLAFPALVALVNDAPQPNDYRHGINVHAGSRDDKTKAALELLWELTKELEIEKLFQSCISYLQGLPESDKKTLALKALFGPRIFSDNFPPLLHGNFSCNGFSLTGKELIGRLWGFISGCDGKNQDECKKGMLTALSTSFEGENLVCNQGKTQRLLIAVLQGRLEGVQIDDLAPVLTPDQAFGLFFQDEQRQGIQDKQELLREANSFLQENPNVQRESFMAKLEAYWNLRGEDQDGAAQDGAAQEE